eukprot:1160599-Pelagomonas_calceolata.AAC.18
MVVSVSSTPLWLRTACAQASGPPDTRTSRHPVGCMCKQAGTEHTIEVWSTSGLWSSRHQDVTPPGLLRVKAGKAHTIEV